MRLLYLCLSPTFGMHQYTADLANRAAEENEVHLIAPQSVPVDRYAPKIIVHSPVNLTSTGLSATNLSAGNLVTIRRLIRDINPAAVHFTAPHIWNPYLLQWLRARQVPAIHTIHDLDPHPGSNNRHILGIWNKLVVRWSTTIVVHNSRYKRRLTDAGISSERVVAWPLLHLFLSYESSRRLEQSEWNVSYEPFALFFGRLAQYKGIDCLMEAIELLNKNTAQELSIPFRLVIAGEGEIPNRWLKSLPSGVQQIPHFIGDSEGIQLFRRCGVVVFPYVGATQSALVSAAYYFRKPVIASRSGALGEYVESGVTGYLVDVEDPVGLAKALERSFSSSEKLAKMGAAGRRWYDQERRRETYLLAHLYRQY